MKIRLLIITGIVVGVVIAGIFIFSLIKQQESSEIPYDTEWDYKNTKQTIDEKFLSKSVREWQQIPPNEIDTAYEKYGSDDFFTGLGRLLIKNEMMQQLKKENIVNANDNFGVYPGVTNTSGPPHISFEAAVNGTDGNSYRLQGGTYANMVSDVTITKLDFFDTNEKLTIESILPQNQMIQILSGNENGPQVKPYNLVIDKDRYGIVGFENKQEIPIQIIDGEDHGKPKWTGPIILPQERGTITFNQTGTFEWIAGSLSVSANGYRQNYGNGEIHVISKETKNLPLDEKGRIALGILHNSKIPWNEIGMERDGIHIDFNPAIFEVLPDTKEYYTARAKQMIPFDVPIIIIEKP